MMDYHAIHGHDAASFDLPSTREFASVPYSCISPEHCNVDLSLALIALRLAVAPETSIFGTDTNWRVAKTASLPCRLPRHWRIWKATTPTSSRLASPPLMPRSVLGWTVLAAAGFRKAM
jgi:hypothetical protein